MDPAELRRHYGAAALRRRDLADDPMTQFRLWFEQAIAAELLEPNAMVLSTVAADQPSSRTVLLKAYDQRGFVFFTNSSSFNFNFYFWFSNLFSRFFTTFL